MKKTLCLLLVAAMLCLCFAGCTSNDEPATSPSDSPEASSPVDDSPAPSDATGEGHSFGFVMMGTGEFFQAISEALKAGFESIGWEASFANGQFDPATQIELIENYTAMGTDVIMVHPVSGDAINSAVDAAREAGSKVIIMVDATNNWDGLMSSDNVATGLCNAWMCAQYVDAHWPDAAERSIPVAVLTCTAAVSDAEQSEGLLRVEEYSDKLYIAQEYEVADGSMEAGMEAAENIYSMNPEITLFIATSNQVAMGVQNYFCSMSSPISESDYPDYGVWGTNSADEALNAIKMTADGKGIFRGINIQSGIPETVNVAIDIATGLMDGRYDHIEVPASVYLVNTENVDDWMADQHVDLHWDFENSVGAAD